MICGWLCIFIIIYRYSSLKNVHSNDSVNQAGRLCVIYEVVTFFLSALLTRVVICNLIQYVWERTEI